MPILKEILMKVLIYSVPFPENKLSYSLWIELIKQKIITITLPQLNKEAKITESEGNAHGVGKASGRN